MKFKEQTTQQLNLIVAELRRSTRILGILAEIEPHQYSQDYAQPASNTSMHSNAVATLDGQYKLYVGNIDYDATESELADHFSHLGEVINVNIPINRYTGRARGFGFITFGSKEEAESAINLHGSEFKGRQIQVNFAKEREREMAQ